MHGDATLRMELKQYIYKTITIIILYNTHTHTFNIIIQINEKQQAADTFFIEKTKTITKFSGI